MAILFNDKHHAFMVTDDMLVEHPMLKVRGLQIGSNFYPLVEVASELYEAPGASIDIAKLKEFENYVDSLEWCRGAVERSPDEKVVIGVYQDTYSKHFPKEGELTGQTIVKKQYMAALICVPEEEFMKAKL